MKTTSKKENKGIAFTAVDPRDKIVVCEDGALCHAIEGHPEVTQDKIKESIIAPAYIRQSKQKATSQIYCDVSDSSKGTGCFYTVVDFNADYSRGCVKTAYSGRESSSKGELIWHPK